MRRLILFLGLICTLPSSGHAGDARPQNPLEPISAEWTRIHALVYDLKVETTRNGVTGTSDVRYRTDGDQWSIRTMGAKLPWCVFVANTEGWQLFERHSGRLEIRHRRFAPPGGGAWFPAHETPLLLEPFAFLGYGRNPPESRLRIEWKQVRDAAWISARWTQSQATVEKGQDGRLTVRIPTWETVTNTAGEDEDKQIGSEFRMAFAPLAEAGGMLLPTHIDAFDATEKRVTGRTTLTWKGFVPADGGKPVFLPAAAIGETLPDHVVTDRVTAVRVEINGKADPADFEIDPTIAKSIIDLDTGMVVQPDAP